MTITRKEKRSLQIAAMGTKSTGKYTAGMQSNVRLPRKGSKAAAMRVNAERALGIANTLDGVDSLSEARQNSYFAHLDYAKECFREGRYDSALTWALQAIKSGERLGSASPLYRKAADLDGLEP